MNNNKNSTSIQAFTLIELSIVLVIIGLITAGIFVGRDLINAAAIRAQVSQIEKLDAAVYMFDSKYGGLPGDLQAAQAKIFHMAARTGAPGDGDGDRMIETSCNSGQFNAYGTTYYFYSESALFWNDLSVAGLIPGSFTLDTDTCVTNSVINFTSGQASQYLPDAKIGNGNSIAVFNVPGYESVLWGGPAACGHGDFCYAIVADVSVSNGVYSIKNGITPLQAFAIDTKMDDGIPNTGKVVGNISVNPGIYINIWNATFAAKTACVTTNTNGYVYNVGDSSNANNPICILNIVHK